MAQIPIWAKERWRQGEEEESAHMKKRATFGLERLSEELKNNIAVLV